MKRDTNSGTDQLRYAGEIQIKLSVQVYGIEVNRKEFDHLRTTASKTIVDRLIFHEYLRLLGVDDNGFKVSMHLEALRRKAFAEPQFPYVGAQVYVPAGVEYLDEKDNQLRRLNTPNRTPRGRYGLIKNIYDVNFRSRAGVELARVVEVQISDVPGLYQIFYHFISDVKHVVKPVP